jgi:hypothetical protein
LPQVGVDLPGSPAPHKRNVAEAASEAGRMFDKRGPGCGLWRRLHMRTLRSLALRWCAATRTVTHLGAQLRNESPADVVGSLVRSAAITTNRTEHGDRKTRLKVVRGWFANAHGSASSVCRLGKSWAGGPQPSRRLRRRRWKCGNESHRALHQSSHLEVGVSERVPQHLLEQHLHARHQKHLTSSWC